jgi:hypothetical protein
MSGARLRERRRLPREVRLDASYGDMKKSAVVRTIWIVRTGESVPRFVTCWVL